MLTFRQINITYLALLGGQLMMALFAVFFVSSSNNSGQENISIVFYALAPMICISSIVGAHLFSNWHFAQIKGPQGMETLLDHYRKGVVIRSALIEGGNIFLIILILMTGQSLFFLIFFAAGMLAFVLMRPSREELKKRYQLTAKQRDELASLQ